MIGFYTFGGGRGHLTRVRKFIEYMNLVNFRILTGSQIAYSIFSPEEIIFYRPKSVSDSLELNVFIGNLLDTQNFDAFYIDCFPAGIFNELNNNLFKEIPVYHLARRLNSSYQLKNLNDPIKFIATYVFEKLAKDHFLHISSQSKEVVSISLPPPVLNIKRALDERVTQSVAPVWLVVHSSSSDETEILLMQAKALAEMQCLSPLIVVITDNAINSTEGIIFLKDESRPFDYFPHVEKIFSSAGFNCIHEVQAFKSKHICIPFMRKYDDQIWRSKNY